jgi:hypothetical protein
LLTVTDSVLLTLWGWPGVLAVLLISWHVAERRFGWRRRLSGRAKARWARKSSAAAASRPHRASRLANGSMRRRSRTD